MNQLKCLILSGATATGKSSLAIAVAKKYKCSIVNFDSLLFYRELNIGTAKPTQAELDEIDHYLVNTHSIATPLNAAAYCREAFKVLEEISQNDNFTILVGGSAFYLRALLYGMYHSPTTPNEILKKSQDLYESKGIAPFYNELKNIDPESYSRLHANDHYRIRRAVEHYWTTGFPFSQSALQHESNALEFPYPFLHLNLLIPKEDHWEIIQQRTQQMLKVGFIHEVETLLKSGFSGQEKPLQSIGYKEVQQFICGEIDTNEELVERISISTRQLAKSQKTFFKKFDPKLTYNPLQQTQEIGESIESFYQDLVKD